MKKIIRNYEPETGVLRSLEENGERFIEGYAAIFNRLSKPLFENNKLFKERIEPGAFDEVLLNPDLDVIYNVNHDNGSILGRTKSGTLELSTDEYGLKFRAKVPRTTTGNDVYELISRNDLYESSFAFALRKGDDEWTKDEQGNNIRTIKKVSKLYDVSTVYSGAYAGTDVFARDEDEEQEDKEEVETIEEPASEETEEEEQKALQATKDELQRMKIHIETLKLKFN